MCVCVLWDEGRVLVIWISVLEGEVKHYIRCILNKVLYDSLVWRVKKYKSNEPLLACGADPWISWQGPLLKGGPIRETQLGGCWHIQGHKCKNSLKLGAKHRSLSPGLLFFILTIAFYLPGLCFPHSSLPSSLFLSYSHSFFRFLFCSSPGLGMIHRRISWWDTNEERNLWFGINLPTCH